jgi:hypothetical protein
MSTNDADFDNIVRLPLEAPPGSTPPARRGPGRPRKIEPAPDVAALEHHASVMLERTRHVDGDALVVAVKARTDAKDTLRLVMRGLAEEAASLEFQQRELAKRGRDTAQVSSRRVDALRKLGDLALRVREADGEALNLSSEQATKLFTLWIERIRDVANALLAPEMVDVFLSRLAASMESFERDAEERLR